MSKLQEGWIRFGDWELLTHFMLLERIQEENAKYLTGQLLIFFGQTQSKGER
jgi:hypothetical protein